MTERSGIDRFEKIFNFSKIGFCMQRQIVKKSIFIQNLQFDSKWCEALSGTEAKCKKSRPKVTGGSFELFY